MRIATTILAALLATVLTCISGARAEPADDLALITQHNTQAHLLALWWLGQPDAAASLSADQARALYRVLGNDEDWRVRWLAAESLAEAHGVIAASGAKDAGDTAKLFSYYAQSLNNLLDDEAQPVREAIARALVTRQPDNRTQVTREMVDALGDRSALVCKPIAGLVGRIIAANPEVISGLLWNYSRADSDPYEKAEDYLEGYVRAGHADAEAGRALLEEHVRELQYRQGLIRQAFKQAGAAAMPELLIQWDEKRQLRDQILAVWTSMDTNAAEAGGRLEPILADLENPLWWDTIRAARWIQPPNREQLALLMLPRLCCEKPSWSLIDELADLGPFSDSVARPVIDFIPEIEGRDQQDLIRMLADIGPHSEIVFDYLSDLTRDETATDEVRDTALRTLANMARAGNLTAARFVLDATASDEKQRSSVLHTLLWDDELLDHHDLVAMLAAEAGALNLALKQPKLLALPDFNAQARRELVAEITASGTSASRLNWLCTLLTSLDPPPAAELEDSLWTRYDEVTSSSSSSSEYITALAALYPARACELYLEICDSGKQPEGNIISPLLTGLGAECAPLLPMLTEQLIGAVAAEQLREFFSGNVKPAYDEGVRAGYDQDFDLYHRYRLALAIQACGSEASPYVPQLLWALKRAFYERSLETIPESALRLPDAQREQMISRCHRRTDQLIKALVGAVAAVGPEALPAVLKVANGSMNDGAVWEGSTASYRNPEYDRRLRNAALEIAGEIGHGDNSVARLLIERCAGEPTWFSWSYRSDEIDHQRTLISVTGLGKLGVASDEVVMALLDAALDEDPKVQAAAVASLRQLAGWEYPAVE